jgi:hypothetical protein
LPASCRCQVWHWRRQAQQRGSTDIAKRRKTLLFRLGRVRDKSSLALIGEKASRLSLLLRRALVGGGHEARLSAAMLSKAVLPTSERLHVWCVSTNNGLSMHACHVCWLFVWGGSVKGDRVRVHLLAWPDRDGELCRVSRNRGVRMRHSTQCLCRYIPHGVYVTYGSARFGVGLRMPLQCMSRRRRTYWIRSTTTSESTETPAIERL